MSLTHSHEPFKFSFQSVTFPSPQLTARMLPAKLHDTLQTTSGNFPLTAGVPAFAGADTAETDGSRVALTHGEVGVSLVQITTVLSCEHNEIFGERVKIRCTNLRGSGNVTPGQSDIRSPGDIPDPVSMTFQNLFLHPTLSVFPIPPNLDKVITARSGKALDGLNGVGCIRWLAGLEIGTGCWGDQRTRDCGRSPGYSIASNRVGVEDVGSPLTVVWAGPGIS